MAARVHAFTRDGAGGNPAGVELSMGSEASMQAHAARLGFSETAFARRVDDGWHVRFFTPTSEVALCGHATIATWHLLHEQGEVSQGSHRMHTAAGPQQIRIENQHISMTQNPPEFGAVVPPDALSRVLGIPEHVLTEPAQVASTGLHKIFAFVEPGALPRLQPDHDGIEALSRSVGAIGIYVVSLGAPLRARNFAPVVGIREDSATGTSAAAVTCLLHHRGLVGRSVEIHQGDILGMPSSLHVTLDDTDLNDTDLNDTDLNDTDLNDTDRVWVGGHATTMEDPCDA